jgi:hypothetical protein
LEGKLRSMKIVAPLIFAVLALASTLVFAYRAYIFRSNPVLFHLFADTNCACGDYQEELSGLVLFNPFRDRSPEAVADNFLEQAREGKCAANTPEAAALCAYTLENHRVAAWRLANRQDKLHRVSLYYKLTKLGEENDSRYRFTGEGLVEVVNTNDGWKVAFYSSDF